MSRNSQPGLRSRRVGKDALYRETLQTTGRTTRIWNRPKRVCVDPQSTVPVARAEARRQCARSDEPRALVFAFLRHGGIYRSDVVQTRTKPRVGTMPPPAGRPRAQGKERVGRTTLFSSSAMSSGRLFLDRVARQQSPSPLHRHPQINMHSSQAQAKGDISTLPAWGHFYFALTPSESGLTRPTGRSDHRSGRTRPLGRIS